MQQLTPVGAGLLAKAVCQSMHPVTGTPLSRASPLPQGELRCSCYRGFFFTAFMTTTKNTGTNTTARVATIMPPITPVPMACWLAELAPVAMANGTTPRINASDVKIGRAHV